MKRAAALVLARSFRPATLCKRPVSGAGRSGVGTIVGLCVPSDFSLWASSESSWPRSRRQCERPLSKHPEASM